MDETLHICYALHDASGHFTKFLGTSLLSLLEHTDASVCVCILLDRSVSAENRARLQEVADGYGQELAFREMDVLFRRPLRRLQLVRPDIARARYTVAAFYRLFLPALFEHGRVLYLDADTVVTCDVQELYALPVGADGIAAASEQELSGNAQAVLPSSAAVVAPGRYFNSGVLLMDFDRMRGMGSGMALTQAMLDFLAAHAREPYFDQDVLNHFFSQAYAPLPRMAHRLVPALQRQGVRETPPGIYHFDAASLGMFRPEDAYDQLFYEYFSMTPWCDGAFLLRAFSAIRDAAPQRVPEAYGAELVRAL